jgi:hypothetical protein
MPWCARFAVACHHATGFVECHYCVEWVVESVKVCAEMQGQVTAVEALDQAVFDQFGGGAKQCSRVREARASIG